MSSTSGGWINLLIVWGIASAVGFVSMAALMLVGDWSVMQALFAAAVIFLGLGIILSVLFLNPLPGPQVPGSAGKKVVAADRKPAAVKPVANPPQRLHRPQQLRRPQQNPRRPRQNPRKLHQHPQRHPRQRRHLQARKGRANGPPPCPPHAITAPMI